MGGLGDGRQHSHRRFWRALVLVAPFKAKGTGRDHSVLAGVTMKGLGGEARFQKGHLLGRKV